MRVDHRIENGVPERRLFFDTRCLMQVRQPPPFGVIDEQQQVLGVVYEHFNM
jgi:hypothetical protein